MRGVSPLVQAVGVLLLGIVFLDGMSALIKFLLPRYGALELSAYRNVVGMVPSIVLLFWAGELHFTRENLVIRQWKLAFGRGLLVMVAQLFYYIALGRMELATVASLGYTMSIFVVLFSIPILGERIGWYRWVAVALGMWGAVWIVRPSGGDALSWWALLPLAAAAFYALTQVTVRLMDKSVSVALLYMYSAVAAAISSIVLVLVTTGFQGIANGWDAFLIVVMGLMGGCGVLCLLISVRLAAPSILAPFNYLGLLSSFTLGWLIFEEAPFATLFPGVLLIVAGGLLVLWREREKDRKRMAVNR